MGALPASVAHLFQVYVPSDPKPPIRSSRTPSTPTSRLIEKLVRHQRQTCSICGTWLSVSVKANSSTGATIDHVVPRSKGGRNEGNRLAAHHACNVRKGDRMPSGCELVMLDAVNAWLGLPHQTRVG